MIQNKKKNLAKTYFFVLSKISLQLLLQMKPALGIMTSVDLYVSNV
jgi:hypothetical protein